MTEGPDWKGLAEQALETARGPQAAAPGAKLRSVLAALVAPQGIDLSAYLRESGLTFSGFLEQYTSLVVLRRSGTDMLVAKSVEELSENAGPALPTPGTALIRQDLYNALTVFVTRVEYYYDVMHDRVLPFSPDAPPDSRGLVPFPPATLQDQIELRRGFAAAQRQPALLEALADERKALSEFQAAVRRLGLEQAWHHHKYEALRRRIFDWALGNRIEVRDSWFGATVARREKAPSMAELLKQLADCMSDDELQQVRIPLRAMHEFWVNQIRRG